MALLHDLFTITIGILSATESIYIYNAPFPHAWQKIIVSAEDNVCWLSLLMYLTPNVVCSRVATPHMNMEIHRSCARASALVLEQS